jgi:hypothetical protein
LLWWRWKTSFLIIVIHNRMHSMKINIVNRYTTFQVDTVLLNNVVVIHFGKFFATPSLSPRLAHIAVSGISYRWDLKFSPCRSQWPRGLRHEPSSSPAWTLGSWDQIPLEAWMSCVRLFCVCVVLFVGSCLETGWSPVQGVLPTVYRLRNWKGGQVPKGYRAIEKFSSASICHLTLGYCGMWRRVD